MNNVVDVQNISSANERAKGTAKEIASVPAWFYGSPQL